MGFFETVGAILVALFLFRLWDQRRSAKIHAEEVVRLLLQTDLWFHAEQNVKLFDKQLERLTVQCEGIYEQLEGIHGNLGAIHRELEWIHGDLDIHRR